MLSANPADVAGRLGDPAPPATAVPSPVPKLRDPPSLPALPMQEQEPRGCMHMVGFIAPSSLLCCVHKMNYDTGPKEPLTSCPLLYRDLA